MPLKSGGKRQQILKISKNIVPVNFVSKFSQGTFSSSCEIDLIFFVGGGEDTNDTLILILFRGLSCDPQVSSYRNKEIFPCLVH